MNFPDELQYTTEHVWVETDGDTAKIGLTEYVQDQLGDVLYVGLAEVGTEFEAGEIFTEIEFSETTTAFSCPLSGEVIAVNEELEDSPELINEGPYDAWILELRILNPQEEDDLLSAGDYEESI
ncbi:MAG: glycine cleavage system protein GcvH [Parasporobacterium sp.]|nr:glycine cleavage system protein GcvH [Parasporobacterium sp.]